ncbi:MAG: acyltransferase family protein [Acidimicrobiales bacterium]
MTDLDVDAPTGEAAPAGVVAPEPVAPAHPPRFPAFDGLRAIAAGTVVGVHTAFVSGVTLRKPAIGIYTARLEIGVAVFFLISGFLLYRPFAVAHLAGGPRPRTGAFWLRRLLRIVPAFWVALFVSTTIIHASSIGPGGWTAYASHYLFLQIYFIPQALKGISQAWTLDVEMSFYLLLPLYAAVLGRRRSAGPPAGRLRRELLGLGVLVAIGMAWRVWDLSLQAHGHLYELMSIWLPAELDLFAAGMLLAIVSAWSHQHGRELALCSRWWFPWASWLAAAAAYYGVCHLGISISVSYVKTELDIARQTLYGAFAFFLLLPAVFGPARQGAIRRFLCSWPMRATGVVSYGIYLWHQSLIDELVKYYPRWFGQRLFFDVAFWGMFGEILGAAIVVATVSYLVIERPALRLKGLLGWFRQGPPGAAHAAGRRAPSTA